MTLAFNCYSQFPDDWCVVKIPGPFIKTISLRVDECFHFEVEEEDSAVFNIFSLQRV